MNATIVNYALYLALAIPLTVWVARTLHKNGRVFLVECFHGNQELADSVNHLLVVGFYLVNIGFVSLYLKTREVIEGTQYQVASVRLLAAGAHEVHSQLGAGIGLQVYGFGDYTSYMLPGGLDLRPLGTLF